MTGRRKSCETCKKVAATSSLPFMEMSVPLVDGVIYQNTDHEEENRTPGFRLRTPDAISYPVTPGAAVADPSLGRTEPTPGFRKTAKLRKAAIQASSFTAVAEQDTQQMDAANHEADNEDVGKNSDKNDNAEQDTQQMDAANHEADNEDAGKNSDKNDNCSYGDNKDPKGGAGCSDPRASKAKVAVHVEAGPTGAIRAAHVGSAPAPGAGPSHVTPTVTETTNVHAGDKLVLLSAEKNSDSHTNPDPSWEIVASYFRGELSTVFDVDTGKKSTDPLKETKFSGFGSAVVGLHNAQTLRIIPLGQLTQKVMHKYKNVEVGTSWKVIIQKIIRYREDIFLKVNQKETEELPLLEEGFNGSKAEAAEADFLRGVFKHIAGGVFLDCLQQRKDKPNKGLKTKTINHQRFEGEDFKICLTKDMDNKPTKVPNSDSEEMQVARIGGGMLKFKLGKYYEAEDFVGHYIYHENEGDPEEFRNQ